MRRLLAPALIALALIDIHDMLTLAIPAEDHDVGRRRIRSDLHQVFVSQAIRANKISVLYG